jgi:hypothetical protein
MLGSAATQSGALSPSFTLVQRRGRASVRRSGSVRVARVRGGRVGVRRSGSVRVAGFRGRRVAGGRFYRSAGYRRGVRRSAFALGLTGGVLGAGLYPGLGYGYGAGLGLGFPLLGLGLGLGFDGGWGGAALGLGAGALLGAGIAGATAGGGSSGLVGFVGRRPVIVRGSPAARFMCARNFQGWSPDAGTVLIGGQATRCPYL